MSNHKCHFVSKAQLNNETYFYCCKDLNVTKNAGKFHCWYVQRQCCTVELDILLLHIYYIVLQHTMAVFFGMRFCTFLQYIT